MKKTYTADQKTAVVLDALSGSRTVAEISSQHEVHASQISTWKTQVADKYEERILAGDIDYFLNKDYTQEISSYTPTIDQSIQDLRKAIQTMSEENKKKSIQYIQNLCKLSKLYVS